MKRRNRDFISVFSLSHKVFPRWPVGDGRNADGRAKIDGQAFVALKPAALGDHGNGKISRC